MITQTYGTKISSPEKRKFMYESHTKQESINKQLAYILQKRNKEIKVNRRKKSQTLSK